jgi:hypothetical protein
MCQAWSNYPNNTPNACMVSCNPCLHVQTGLLGSICLRCVIRGPTEKFIFNELVVTLNPSHYMEMRPYHDDRERQAVIPGWVVSENGFELGEKIDLNSTFPRSKVFLAPKKDLIGTFFLMLKPF